MTTKSNSVNLNKSTPWCRRTAERSHGHNWNDVDAVAQQFSAEHSGNCGAVASCGDLPQGPSRHTPLLCPRYTLNFTLMTTEEKD